MNTKENLSIEESIKFGWKSVFVNAKFTYGFIGIMAVLTIIQNIINPQKDNNLLYTEFNSTSFIISMFFSILAVYLYYGILKGSFQIIDNKVPKLEILKKTTLEKTVILFLLQIVSTLITIGGLILFIIPGIYFSLKYSQVKYLYVDKNLPFWENFKESSKITKGHKLKIFLFWIVLVLFNCAGLLCLVIGLLITIPASIYATSHFYKTLSQSKAH